MKKNEKDGHEPSTSRRDFLTGAAALGAATAATLAAAPAAQAEVRFPADRGRYGAGGVANSAVNRSENTLYDCEVEGDAADRSRRRRSIASVPTRSTRSPPASTTTSRSTAKAT
jgi:hypothetical protein